jgi:hypothetical protein
MDASVGHIGFAGSREFFWFGERGQEGCHVRTAPSCCPLDVNGYRMGSRFCSEPWWWERWGAAEMRAQERYDGSRKAVA